MMNYKKNRRYFFPTKITAFIFLLIFGVLLIIIREIWFIGLLFLIAAFVFLFLGYMSNVKDKEYEKIAKESIGDIKSKAMNKLGLDEEMVKEISPIILQNYYYANISGECLMKVGKDNKLRASNYQATVFFFSEQQVYCYDYIYSLIASERKELTDEYFYNDIVSIATSTGEVKYRTKKGIRNNTMEFFKLTTSGGTTISAAVRGDDPNVQRSINAMKQLIRNKKAQTK